MPLPTIISSNRRALLKTGQTLQLRSGGLDMFAAGALTLGASVATSIVLGGAGNPPISIPGAGQVSIAGNIDASLGIDISGADLTVEDDVWLDGSSPHTIGTPNATVLETDTDALSILTGDGIDGGATTFGSTSGDLDISTGDGGDSSSSYSGTGGSIGITAGSAGASTTAASGAGGAINIKAGNTGTASAGSGFAGAISITAGNCNNTFRDGGSISIRAGNALYTQDNGDEGGSINITAGTGGNDAVNGGGGNISISGGAGGRAGAWGGDVTINAGGGNTAADGDVNIGAANTNSIKLANATDNPNVEILGAGALLIGANPASSGDGIRMASGYDMTIRNAGNTADLLMIGSDGADNMYFNTTSASGSNSFIYCRAGRSIYLSPSGTAKLQVDNTGIAFFAGAISAQLADMGALTDATTGAAGATINDVTAAFNQGILNNNFASLLAKINTLRDSFRAFSLMA